MEGGLRERKKERTRQAIVDAAMRLFDERGFEATTIADIAAAADIAPRTFFGYFAGKEEVIFADTDEVLDDFAGALDSRPADQSAFEALLQWFHEFQQRNPDLAEHDRITAKLAEEVPAIAAHELAIHARFEALIARGVARDLGVEDGDHRTKMVAASAMTAYRVISEDKHAAPDRMGELIEDVSRFVDGGMRALRRDG